MSVVNTRTTRTTRYEYLVPQPAAYADVMEAVAFAKRDATDAGKDTSCDDSLMVTHDDENVIVFWEDVKR